MSAEKDVLISELQSKVTSLKNELQQVRTTLQAKLNELTEQLAWFQRQLFGKKSEKFEPVKNKESSPTFWDLPGMEDCFPQDATPKEETILEVPGHQRRSRKSTGKDKFSFPDNLPKKITVLDIPEADKICPITNQELVCIGKEISSKLAYTPGSYYIKQTIRPKYALPRGGESGIRCADLPEGILPRCMADESLLAQICTMKFADHLPCNRIVEIFSRDGILATRQLLSSWIIKLGEALEPLYNEMLKEIRQSENVFADETPVKLMEKGRGECKQSYLWALVGGKAANPPYRVYQFFSNRKHENAEELLGKNFRGVLHSDKYGAYEALVAKNKEIIWCPCTGGHARRKFFEAEAGDPKFREWILEQIAHLYEIENEAWKKSPEERVKIRQEQEAPIIDEMMERVKERIMRGDLLPKSKFMRALSYLHSLKPYLKNYIQHPFARLDNNVAERAMRAVAIGRKNWLFFGGENGGKAAAIIYSFVQTCRALDINPREYLEDIFRRLMSHNSSRLVELLPDQWKLGSNLVDTPVQ